MTRALATRRPDAACEIEDVEREVLPAPAALAMPRQPWNAAPAPAGRPDTSPANIAWRRLVFFSSTILLTMITMIVPIQLYARDGFAPLEMVGVALLGVLLLALTCWFCNAVAGLAVLMSGRANDGLGLPDAAPAPQSRTALLMPLYNEDADAAIGRLAAMERAISALGAADHFDLFVLSDSRRPEVLDAEWAAYLALSAKADCAVYYRARAENHERKVGNISDWVRRFGAAYPYMVVLDADSSMSGDTLLKLVDAMERLPGVGLIQTAPTIINATTLFARASQFGVRLYGRIAAAGLAWWCGSEASYWGHNAIVRVQAFAACAGLAALQGRKPFGGEILSHDVVEAALLRRGGWAVHVAPTLDGSLEETPPALLDFMRRERRWCQGNLQHLALVTAPGLHWISRLQFIMGAMCYLASPLWLASLLVGLAIEVQSPVDWGSFWYILTPRVTPFLWASVLSGLLLMGPKILGLVLVVCRKDERRAFGGMRTLLRSAALEALQSAVTAPLLMASNTRIVFEVMFGRDAGWAAQRRTADRVSVWQAVRAHRWEMTVGLFLASALVFRPDLSLLFSPVVLPLLLSGPLAALISNVRIGQAAKVRSLLVTPEERAQAQAELEPISAPVVVHVPVATWPVQALTETRSAADQVAYDKKIEVFAEFA